MIYYSFTSLSTIGFGDFHPKSDIERLLCAIILVMGVAVFSSIMGIFIEILEKVRQIEDEVDESEQLSLFLSLIQKFNKGKKMNKHLKLKIE